jgi:hypothetical protein
VNASSAQVLFGEDVGGHQARPRRANHVGPPERRSEDHLADIHMLAMTSGRERSETDFAGPFQAAGLRLHRIVPTAVMHSVIDARKD